MFRLVLLLLGSMVFAGSAALAEHGGGSVPTPDAREKAHPCDTKSKSLREAAEKTELVSPSFFLRPPLDGYRKIVITARYGDERERVVGSFSPPFDLKSGVATEWNVGKDVPEKDRYSVRYKISAGHTDGDKVFETDWISTDRAVVCVGPQTWKGPRTVPVQIDTSALKAAAAKLGLVKFKWKDRDGADRSRTLIWREKEGAELKGDLPLHWSTDPLSLSVELSHRKDGELVTVPAVTIPVRVADSRLRLSLGSGLAPRRQDE